LKGDLDTFLGSFDEMYDFIPSVISETGESMRGLLAKLDSSTILRHEHFACHLRLFLNAGKECIEYHRTKDTKVRQIPNVKEFMEATVINEFQNKEFCTKDFRAPDFFALASPERRQAVLSTPFFVAPANNQRRQAMKMTSRKRLDALQHSAETEHATLIDRYCR